MEFLGIIPARGGSKSIPRKNLARIGGLPLLAYTCEAALASQRLTRVILSTEDTEIAAVGREHGVEVPFLRPVQLADDDTPALPVIKQALEWLDENENYRPDVVILLQPTSPLRRSDHIDGALDLLLESGADSVVSVVELPHQYRPVSVMKIEEDRLVPLLPGEGTPMLRRQEKPTVYARNGPAIYASHVEALLKRGELYGGNCVAYLMSRDVSFDIDEPIDLVICEALLSARGAQGSSGTGGN